MKIKKKPKSKLYRTLEDGNLLFNLILAAWFLALVVVFSGIFKLVFPYKIALIIRYTFISMFLINFIFKIADIYAACTKESVQEKVWREIMKKRLKQKPSSESQS